MAKIKRLTITVLWPDDKWNGACESEYLVACLQEVSDKVEIVNGTSEEVEFFNPFGRCFATALMETIDGQESAEHLDT